MLAVFLAYAAPVLFFTALYYYFKRRDIKWGLFHSCATLVCPSISLLMFQSMLQSSGKGGLFDPYMQQRMWILYCYALAILGGLALILLGFVLLAYKKCKRKSITTKQNP